LTTPSTRWGRSGEVREEFRRLSLPQAALSLDLCAGDNKQETRAVPMLSWRCSESWEWPDGHATCCVQGPWVQKSIPNADFFEDEAPLKSIGKIGAVAFEVRLKVSDRAPCKSMPLFVA
jgi:hypothetical protein